MSFIWELRIGDSGGALNLQVSGEGLTPLLGWHRRDQSFTWKRPLPHMRGMWHHMKARKSQEEQTPMLAPCLRLRCWQNGLGGEVCGGWLQERQDHHHRQHLPVLNRSPRSAKSFAWFEQQYFSFGGVRCLLRLRAAVRIVQKRECFSCL